MSLDMFSVPGSRVADELAALGVTHLVTVPDWVQMSLHAEVARGRGGLSLINTCSENQCVTVGAGLQLGGAKPVLVMQNQGFYNCVNTVRAVCMDAHIPLVFLVGQFGREFANFGQDPRRSRRTMVRLMEPLLDAMELPHWRLESPQDIACLTQAFATAREKSTAAVVLIGAPMAWS